MANQLVKPNFNGPYTPVQYTPFTYGVESVNGINVGRCDGTGAVLFPCFRSAKEAAETYNKLWT
jgi:hypothetical protein